MLKKYMNVKNVENIVFIPPEKKVDTYEFLKSGIDLVLVYDGSLGVEIPFQL